jgi:hypothetical protein
MKGRILTILHGVVDNIKTTDTNKEPMIKRRRNPFKFRLGMLKSL